MRFLPSRQKSAVKSFTPAPYYPGRAIMTPQQYQVAVKADLQTAYKSVSFSQYVQDFINNGRGGFGENYSEYQLEAAYQTSVYLFAALRRVANLFSCVKIVAEEKKGNAWERLPEPHPLNELLEKAGAIFLFKSYIFYATYGSTLTYKRRTLKAKDAASQGKMLWKFGDDAISALHIIPNQNWSMRENEYDNEILGFDVYTGEATLEGQHMLDPKQCIYWHDLDLSNPNDAVPMVSLAINNAVTNAAIARWAAQYFMSGAMPLLIVSPNEDDPRVMAPADEIRYQNRFEKLWQGIWGKFSLKSMFVSHKFDIQEYGIAPDKVTAPELNRDALNAISSVFQIAPDLIVPPEGGSDNARHKHLILQAYTDAVIPPAKMFVVTLNTELGLDDTDLRLVVAEDLIPALEGDRRDKAETETTIFNTGIQTYGTTQERMGIPQIKGLENFVNVNGRVQSIGRLVRDDKFPNPDTLQYINAAWNDGALKRNAYLKLMMLPVDSDEPDGFKYELVSEPGMGGGGYGAPPSSSAPQDAKVSPPSGQEKSPPAFPPNPVAKEPIALPDGGAAATQEENEQAQEPDVKSDHPEPAERTVITPVSAVTEVPLPEATPEEVPVEEKSACIYLKIGDDSLVKTALENLQLAMGADSEEVNWEPAERWHCTLAYADHCGEDTLGNIYGLLPASLPYLPLRVAGLIIFDTHDGKNAICLNIELDNDLANLQNRVVTAFSANRVAVGDYSQTQNYNPHITLGYWNHDKPLPAFDVSIIVVPSAITICQADYEITHEIPLADVPNAIEARDEYARRNDLRRRKLRALMRQWNKTSQLPDEMPGSLNEALQDAMDSGARGDLLDAAMDAINDGYFDEHSIFIENPIIRLMRKNNGKHAMQKSAKEELDAWKKFSMKRGTKGIGIGGRFEAEHIPLDIEFDVRADLQAAKSKDDIHAVFEKAFNKLAEVTAVPETTEDYLQDWAERMAESGDEDLIALLGSEEEE